MEYKLNLMESDSAESLILQVGKIHFELEITKIFC